VSGFVSLFMFFYALTTLPVATAMTLNYTSPLFLALLLTWIARERPRRVLLATVGLGFVGAILLLRPTLTAAQVWPAAIGLASGAISAIAYWNVRELVRAQEPEARVVFYFALFASSPAVVDDARRPGARSASTTSACCAIGAFGTAGRPAGDDRAYGRRRTLVTAALSWRQRHRSPARWASSSSPTCCRGRRGSAWA
jgi:drug/metabolite transporter (DMT)-like permease